MANKALFGFLRGARRAETQNHAGGAAYKRSDEQALAQLAATGCLNQTFYLDAETQLETLFDLGHKVEPDFLAKTALWARQEGYMKDMPALLMAILSTREPDLLSRAFPHVIDNGRMIRNFVQIIRSGAVGRTSLGSRPKRLIQAWLNQASDQALLAASVGQSPSLADIIRMTHPKPASAERAAFFAWLVGKPCDVAKLPMAVQDFLAFKKDPKGSPIPDVPFQMLTALPLTDRHWAKIAERGGWHMLRMNLNTLQRNGVFKLTATTRRLADRLSNANEIARARVFPYQLMAAWMHAHPDLPESIRTALQDAMEISVGNVPKVKGVVAVCPDVSGSMTMSVSGWRRGATSKIRCVDVAGLMAASVLRANPDAFVLPFEHDVVKVRLNPRDTVLTNAHKLAAVGGGGTSCSAPLAKLNAMRQPVDMVILISDNESWADRGAHWGTPLMREWMRLKSRNPDAKLVCLDITPNTTTPAHERPDVLNIGGFSDRVFDLIAAFSEDRLNAEHWVGAIKRRRLD